MSQSKDYIALVAQKKEEIRTLPYLGISQCQCAFAVFILENRECDY